MYNPVLTKRMLGDVFWELLGRFFSLRKREGWKRELACYLELCGMKMQCEELRQPSWEHDGDTDEKLKLAGQMKGTWVTDDTVESQ